MYILTVAGKENEGAYSVKDLKRYIQDIFIRDLTKKIFITWAILMNYIGMMWMR